MPGATPGAIAGPIIGPGAGAGPTIIPDPPGAGPGPMVGPGPGVGPTIICALAAVTGPINSAAASNATRGCVMAWSFRKVLGGWRPDSELRRPFYQPEDSGSKAAEGLPSPAGPGRRLVPGRGQR
jgi:hypothetical protein